MRNVGVKASSKAPVCSTILREKTRAFVLIGVYLCYWKVGLKPFIQIIPSPGALLHRALAEVL